MTPGGGPAWLPARLTPPPHAARSGRRPRHGGRVKGAAPTRGQEKGFKFLSERSSAACGGGGRGGTRRVPGFLWKRSVAGSGWGERGDKGQRGPATAAVARRGPRAERRCRQGCPKKGRGSPLEAPHFAGTLTYSQGSRCTARWNSKCLQMAKAGLPSIKFNPEVKNFLANFFSNCFFFFFSSL